MSENLRRVKEASHRSLNIVVFFIRIEDIRRIRFIKLCIDRSSFSKKKEMN
jgi:hypothetical protein